MGKAKKPYEVPPQVAALAAELAAELNVVAEAGRNEGIAGECPELEELARKLMCVARDASDAALQVMWTAGRRRRAGQS